MAKYIIGIDEAGRGPLAGPIVAAGVISRGLKREAPILNSVEDSKKLTPKKRQELFLPLIKNFTWSVKLLDNNFIDRYGIQAANTLLFYEIAEDLLKQSKKPASIIADYVGGADRSLPNINFYKQGESQFKEIAAASIIAKVYRDSLMSSLDKYFPHYHFWLHKGYGTKQHFNCLDKYGPCSIHRRSFLSKYF